MAQTWLIECSAITAFTRKLSGTSCRPPPMSPTTKLVTQTMYLVPRAGKGTAWEVCEGSRRFRMRHVRMGIRAGGTVADLYMKRLNCSRLEAEHVEAKNKLFPIGRGGGTEYARAYRSLNAGYLNTDGANHVCNTLVELLALSGLELTKVVSAFPQVLGQRPRTTEAKLQKLSMLLGLSDAELKKVVLGAPSVIGLRFEENVKPSLQALQELLGLSDAELRKVVLGAPPVIGLSFEENVKPSLQALQELLGLSDAELRKVVLRAPTVTGYSFEENVKPSLQALQELLGLSDAELRKVVVGMPPVIGYSFEENVKPTLQFLQLELELSDAELRNLILRSPSILGTGLDVSLRPTVMILREELSREGLLLRSEVLRRGLHILKYSFGKRVQPRVMRARAVGVAVGAVLRAICYTDVKFDEWLTRQCAL